MLSNEILRNSARSQWSCSLFPVLQTVFFYNKHKTTNNLVMLPREYQVPYDMAFSNHLFNIFFKKKYSSNPPRKPSFNNTHFPLAFSIVLCYYINLIFMFGCSCVFCCYCCMWVRAGVIFFALFSDAYLRS